LVGVNDTVGDGVGVTGVYPLIEKLNPTIQAFAGVVGVGVTGKAVTDISTNSQGIDGVGVTNGS
jgi:hypothetical protein